MLIYARVHKSASLIIRKKFVMKISTWCKNISEKKLQPWLTVYVLDFVRFSIIICLSSFKQEQCVYFKYIELFDNKVKKSFG